MQSKGQMEASDAALVVQARAGDGDAFRVLVERHSRRLFRLAYRIVGNEEDAEDVVQETFLRTYRSLEKFNEQAQFSSWIYRIASNYALDLLRLRKKRTEQSLSTPMGEDDGEAYSERLASEDPGPDRVAAGALLQEKIRGAMDELTPQEQVAFTLRHFEGRSVEEIGATLDLTAGATRNAVFRGVQKMRRALKPQEGVGRWRN